MCGDGKQSFRPAPARTEKELRQAAADLEEKQKQWDKEPGVDFQWRYLR